LWRTEAVDRWRRSYGGRASTDGAPKPNERHRRTLGPVVTVVAQGAVGFDNSDGGSWKSAHGSESRRRVPRSGARWRPPPATTSAFPRRERRRRTSLGGERWRIEGPIFMHGWLAGPLRWCMAGGLGLPVCYGSLYIYIVFYLFIISSCLSD
jgi:hypothetical protein